MAGTENVRLAQYGSRGMRGRRPMDRRQEAAKARRSRRNVRHALACAAAAVSWAASFGALLASEDPYLNVVLLLSGALCGLIGADAFNKMKMADRK